MEQDCQDMQRRLVCGGAFWHVLNVGNCTHTVSSFRNKEDTFGVDSMAFLLIIWP